ncbi:internal kinesin motor domain protein [Besnoitia besnoiti]|uniref:Internal kinesin motor domain protein n=1 Tax=Besnoitia besnoiti TaxID=94643 RepID=A0A2A9MEJ0_BESBE|nr:internal kinesin motor domain protein [Besnoitia besnoiti]PFH34691.1 internal kinesin motor domain protein [Besnoitia besnoiti]
MLSSPSDSDGALSGAAAVAEAAWRASLGASPRPRASDSGVQDGSAAPTAPRATSSPSRALPRIAVVVRKRPLSEAERRRSEADLVQTRGGNAVFVDEPREKVDLTPYVMRHEFRVDYAFDERDSNADVYRAVVKPLVEACCLRNANTSCFAYGQTGSGKTYTMLGLQPYGRGIEAGVFELAADDIFKYIDGGEKEVFVSFFEIYNGKLFDLLQNRKLVAALENGKKEVIVKDLRVEQVRDKAVLLSKMIEGVELRKIGANSVNDESSRSHAILQVMLREKNSEETCGRIAFIDLAGSERGADTLQHSRQTQQDGAGINRSLLALKECIRAMDQDKVHIPFRDSELTKVLREIFVGRSSRSVMIATVSPSTSCCEQTLNTLRYASRVKNFRQVPPTATPAPASASLASLPSRPSSSSAEATGGRSIFSANAGSSRHARASHPSPALRSSSSLPSAFSAGSSSEDLGFYGRQREAGARVSPRSDGRVPLSQEDLFAGGERWRDAHASPRRARVASPAPSSSDSPLLRSAMSLPEHVRTAAQLKGMRKKRDEKSEEKDRFGMRRIDEAGGGGVSPPRGVAAGRDPGECSGDLRKAFLASSARLASRGSLLTASASGEIQYTSAPNRASVPAASPSRLGSVGLPARSTRPATSTAASSPLKTLGSRARYRDSTSVGSFESLDDALTAPSPLPAGAALRRGGSLGAGKGADERRKALESRTASLGPSLSSSRGTLPARASPTTAPKAAARRQLLGTVRSLSSSGFAPTADDRDTQSAHDLVIDARSEELEATRVSSGAVSALKKTSALLASAKKGGGDRGSVLPRVRNTRATTSSSPFGATRFGLNSARSSLLSGSPPPLAQQTHGAALRASPVAAVSAAATAAALDSAEGLGLGSTGKTTRGRGGEAFEIALEATGTVSAATAVVEPSERRSLGDRDARAACGEEPKPASGSAGLAASPPLSQLRKTWLRAQHQQQSRQGALVCPDGSSVIFVPRHGRESSSSPALGPAPVEVDMVDDAREGRGRAVFSTEACTGSRAEEDGDGKDRTASQLQMRLASSLSSCAHQLSSSPEDAMRSSSASASSSGFTSRLQRPSPLAGGAQVGEGGEGRRLERGSKSSMNVPLDASSQRLLAHLLPRGFSSLSASGSCVPAFRRGSSPTSPSRRSRAAGDGDADLGEGEDDGEVAAESASYAKRTKKTEGKRDEGAVLLAVSSGHGDDRETAFGKNREPQAILRDEFACATDYHELDLEQLDTLQRAVHDRRGACMQQLLQLAKKRAEDASSRHGINESQQDLLVCRLHQANPESNEFGEYVRQRMETDFRKLLAMRQLWVEAEELRMLHRLLTTEAQTKSGVGGAHRQEGGASGGGASPASKNRPLPAGETRADSSFLKKKADLEVAGDVEMTDAFPSPPLLTTCSPLTEGCPSLHARHGSSPLALSGAHSDSSEFVEC